MSFSVVAVSKVYKLDSNALDTHYLVWTEIEYTVHATLHKLPINQFKQVQHSRQQALRAYCPNIYTLVVGVGVYR